MSGWPGAADGAPAAPRLSTAASASVAGSDILLLSEPGVRDLAVRPVVADGREPVVQRRLELRLALPEAEPELLAGLFDKRDFTSRLAANVSATGRSMTTASMFSFSRSSTART